MSNEIDITLFEPSGRDMQLDYPEFKDYKEFNDLTAREIRLCWLIGNRTSPIAHFAAAQRLRHALEQVYPKQSRNRDEYKQMYDGVIPEKIKLGINRMASFRPSIRLRAKLMDEYVFDQLNSLIHVTESDRKAMDTDEKKKYADLVIKVSSELPDMVTRMEAGYGVKTSKKEEDVSVKANIKDIRDRI